MKNQYFGDINDYRKYGLLRSLLLGNELTALVAWMLTPDDGGQDGSARSYLEQPNRWRHFDPSLYDGLLELKHGSTSQSVQDLEASNLLPRTSYFSETVPDQKAQRGSWSNMLYQFASGVAADLVFVDPDNGILVPSRPIGSQDSSKYVSWQELSSLWSMGHSLLIYQHFPRVSREIYIRRTVQAVNAQLNAGSVVALRTPRVLFILAAQPEHKEVLHRAIAENLATWQGQIDVVDVEEKERDLAPSRSTARSHVMKPVQDSKGTILNAAVLKVEDVVHKRVLCPCCGEKVFKRWPEGWDAHAAFQCTGLQSTDESERKTDFKAALQHLFRT